MHLAQQKKKKRLVEKEDFLFTIVPLFSCALYLIHSDTALQ